MGGSGNRGSFVFKALGTMLDHGRDAIDQHGLPPHLFDVVKNTVSRHTNVSGGFQGSADTARGVLAGAISAADDKIPLAAASRWAQNWKAGSGGGRRKDDYVPHVTLNTSLQGYSQSSPTVTPSTPPPSLAPPPAPLPSARPTPGAVVGGAGSGGYKGRFKQVRNPLRPPLTGRAFPQVAFPGTVSLPSFTASSGSGAVANMALSGVAVASPSRGLSSAGRLRPGTASVNLTATSLPWSGMGGLSGTTPVASLPSVAASLSMPRGGPGGAASNFQFNDWQGVALGAGAGAVIGGLNSDDGFSFSGAAKGAFGGAAIGGGLRAGMPRLGAGISGNPWAMGQLGRAAPWVDSANAGMATSEGRAALWATGGLLGGTFIGGYRNKRRGFNKNRGNRI